MKTGWHKDSCLSAINCINKCLKSSTTEAAVDSLNVHTKQHSDFHMINQCLIKIEENNADSSRMSASIKQDAISDPSLNSFLNPNKDFDKETHHKEKNNSQETVSSSMKIVTTESDTGKLQMFLIDDLNIDIDEGNSCNSSSQLKTQKTVNNIGNEKLYSQNQYEVMNKGKLTVKICVARKVPKHASLENEQANNNCEETKQCDKPNKKDLRLKTCKESVSNFSYQMYSDEDNMAKVDNQILTIRALITKTSRNGKSRIKNEFKKKSDNASNSKNDNASETKLHMCSICNLTCKTVSSLKQHAQTHNISKPINCTHCGYSCKKNSDMKKHEETHGPKSMYKCTECHYSGKRLRYLKKHMRTHSTDVSFSCHLCDFRSLKKVSFDNHLLTHSILKPYSCVDCGKSFKKNYTLQNHIASHSNGGLFICVVCAKAFKEKDLLERHEARHNKQGTDMNPSINCDIASKNLAQRRNIVSEVDNSNHDNSKGIPSTDDGDKTAIADLNIKDSNKKLDKEELKICGVYEIMKTKGEPVQCTLCKYSCASKRLLCCHMRQHSDYKSYVCPQCGAAFKRKDHLKVHRLTHSDIRPFKCPHCLYGTHRKYRLKLHILTHQTIKPVKCSLCSYNCRRDCELRYHMRNKHGIEPTLEPTAAPPSDTAGDVVLKCELCDYTCDSQKRLKYHMTRHDNKTPHSCPHCDYKCSSRSSLTDHLLQHAGIKPCLCSVCGMAFRNTSRLNRHKLVHSDVKPFECSLCDFSSRSKYNLKQHVLRHTDQERARRRNRKSTQPKSSKSNNNEAIKQDNVQFLVDHIDTNLCLDNAQSQQDENQVIQELKTSSKCMAFPPVPIAQYNKNQIDITNNDYKYPDRNINHNSGSSSFNTAYQPANMNMHTYHIERSSCTNALTPIPSYSNSYQNPNPFLIHQHPMPYNPNFNTGPTNPNYCYLDRDGSGYGFANSCFYNEAVYTGNMNPNMNLYMCQNNSSTYTIDPNSTLPTNPNFSNLNPPISQQMIPPILPPALEPLVPTVTENQNQHISEIVDSHIDNLTMSEDISVNSSIKQRMIKPKLSRSQAKKTGATLNSGKVITEVSHGENTTKLTHVCLECGYICLTNTMLQRHKTTHIDLKPHKCEDCGKSFKRLDHMKAHKRTHSKDKPFNCKHCTYTCSRKYRLKLHEITHTHDEHIYFCNICDSTLNTEQELEVHRTVHSDGFMFACSKCNFRCNGKTELRSHDETHKTLLCEECSYVCRSRREFTSHKRMHAEKEELVCSLCNYKCDSQKRLKYHMERHKNKTPHECSHCDYKCSSRSSLTDHLLQHEGLKPFLCSTCGMKFRNVSRLNRHKMTHTDVKPHTCEYCPFSSRSRYNLKQHILRHFK